MLRIKLSVLFLVYLFFFAFSVSANEVNLKKYVGVWNHIKNKEEYKNAACPEKILIKNIGKNKLNLTSVRKTVSKRYIFHKNKTTQGKNKMMYKKRENPELDKTHTVRTIYNTAIVNGNLSVSIFWSSSKMKALVVGLKVFSINEGGNLILERIVSGYVDEKGVNVREDKIQKVFFRHPNNYSMNSNAFSCQFKKTEKDQKK